MMLNAFTVLMPIFFVLGLGYAAGRMRKFDADQIEGISLLVMGYAMPAMLFVATVSTKRKDLMAEVPFLLALLGAFLGLFLVMFLFSKCVLRQSTGQAALQANLVSCPSVGFIGPPIFRGLFGSDSLVAIATATVLSVVTLVPLTMVLLEVHHAREQAQGDARRALGAVVLASLGKTFRQPMVLMPLIGVALVLADVQVPQIIDNMLSLIGSTTSGASIFLAGLVISAYKITINGQVIGNAMVKLIGQPLLMALLVAGLGVSNPLGREGILICTIPTAILAPLIAPRYKVYEAESASTLVLTAVAMIVTMPVAIVLTGA